MKNPTVGVRGRLGLGVVMEYESVITNSFNLIVCARDAAELKESPISCKDDTGSESSDSDDCSNDSVVSFSSKFVSSLPCNKRRYKRKLRVRFTSLNMHLRFQGLCQFSETLF